MLVLSSETYDQNVRLFLPRKPVLNLTLLLFPQNGHLIEFLRQLPKAVKFHIHSIRL